MNAKVLIPLLSLLVSCFGDEDKADSGSDVDADTDTDADADADADADTDTDTDTDLSVGPDDDYAAAACILFETDPTALTAASSQADAGQVIIEPDAEVNYLVERPAPGADAWLTVQVSDWAVEVRFFVSEGVEYELVYDNADVELLRDVADNGHCPDAGIGDQEYKVHSWGDYPLHFFSGSEDPIRLTVIQED